MAGAGERSAICIIPARGGSKRIPRKNVRLFDGLPLIAHSIRAALASGSFSRIVVSTDDLEIAAISREHGADIPFMRDKSLSGDFTGTAEVILDAIEKLGAQETEFSCCLYPTAPLVTPGDLRDALARLAASDADALVPVTGFDYPPLRALKTLEGGRVAFNWPEYAQTRSQDTPGLVHDAGAFYWLRTKPFMKTRRIVGENTIGWPVDRSRAIDIDTEEDFGIAEALARLRRVKRDAE